MQCIKCDGNFPSDAFHKNPRYTDGLNHTCKTCCAAYQQAYAERPKIPPPTDMLLCIRCAIEKPLTEFYRSKHHKDGFNHTCKACIAIVGAQYRATHPEQIRTGKRAWEQSPEGKTSKKASYRRNRTAILLQQKQYRIEHADEISIRNHIHYKANQETADAKTRAWTKAHPEERKAIVHRYYETHKDECLQRMLNWRNKNPEKALTIAVMGVEKRRALLQNAPVNDLTIAQWDEIKAAYGHRCVYCGRKMQRLTQDHIIPLSKGGSHTASNIVPACKSCNSRKGDRSVLVPVQPLLLTVAPPSTNSSE